MKYKAGIFDLDDTLYDYQSLNKKAIELIVDLLHKKENIDNLALKEAFCDARQEINQRLKGTASSHNRLLYFQKMCEKLELNPLIYALDMYEIYWGFILDNMSLNSGVKELFDFMKFNNIKIAICTDLTGHIQHRKIRKLNITNYIDALVTSEEVGAEKPNQLMFKEVLAKLNMKSSDVFLVGDNYQKDIMGAKKEGIVTFHYNIKEGNCNSFNYFNEIKNFII